MHGLKADGVLFGIRLAALANNVALMPVGSINLHGGFGSIYLHRDACGEVAQSCYWGSKTAVKQVAVIIATRDVELRMVSIDALADGGGMTEVEWGVGDAHHLSCHLFLVIVEADAVGIYPQQFVKHAAAEVGGEIKERVIRGIQHRRLRGRCLIVDAQSVVE